MNRQCENCGVSIDNTHRNRKFCSLKCYEKSRYKKYGQRITVERRKELYQKRVSDKNYRRKLNDKANKRNHKIKKFLQRYKLLVGCADCGYKKHHAALDFDHVKGEKNFNVCFAKSIKQAKEEIRKCQVVCSNCHRIRTYNRVHNL